MRVKRELECLEVVYNCKFTNRDKINNIIDSCIAINNINDCDDFFVCVGEHKQLFEDALYHHFTIRCMFSGCTLNFSLLGLKNEDLSK